MFCSLISLLIFMCRADGGSPTADRQLAMRRSPSLPPGGIVHLIIRKSGAAVHWRHAPGAKVELSISADATAEDVAAELEAANDLPAEQYMLKYNGEVRINPSESAKQAFEFQPYVSCMHS